MWRCLLLAGLAGCVEPDLAACSDGLACPVGDLCDEVHHSCASPQQFDACAGAAPDADCSAGPITGGCFDGVCLPRGCGNAIVEPGEVCDDGNQLSRDGCRSDCRSDETCGNGVVDEAETCDDGNHMAHDGCDSRCQLEQAAWTILALQPRSFSRDSTAYDEARHRLVAVTGDGVTWEWDGTRWTTQLPPIATVDTTQFRLFYDPDHARVEMIGLRVQGVQHIAFLSGWNGTQWSVIAQAPIDQNITAVQAATYDLSLHRPVAALYYANVYSYYYSVDDAGGWVQASYGPDLSEGGDITAAYDPVDHRVVILQGYRDVSTGYLYSREWAAYDGSWIATVTPMSPSGLSLFYNAARGHLAVIDGQSMLERVGNNWMGVGAGMLPTQVVAPAVMYDALTATVTMLRADVNTVLQWSGGAWVASDGPAPVSLTGIAADPAHHRLVVSSTDALDQTWSFDGAWHRLVPAHQPGPRGRIAGVMAYDPVRGAIVLHGGITTAPSYAILHDTWLYDGTDWSQLSDADPITTADAAPSALAYDPTAPGLVLDYGYGLWSLPSMSASWAYLGAAPSLAPVGDVGSIAWDAGDAKLVAISGTGVVFDRSSSGWQTSLSLVGTGYSAFADARRGTIVMVPLDGHAVRVWERDHGSWTERARMPIAITGTAAYDPVLGRIVVLGSSLGGTYALVRSSTSSAADESCAPGEDVDGDGLAGCTDPDCWWQCTPACPPYTTCP